MAFIAANGLTEQETGTTIEAGGMKIHYHDIGQGEPILFLHSYGPGSTAWITFHKVVAEFAGRYRCILFDLPNFAKSGPFVYNESSHAFQARVATQLLDALDIADAFWVGNSQGGQSCLVAAIKHPERVRKFVLGGGHVGTADIYVMANRPSEGTRTYRVAIEDPSDDNLRRYLRAHLYDQELVTDELVDYIHHWHTWSPELTEAREKSANVVVNYTEGLSGIKAPAFMVHGRDDRMVPFEVSIKMLNHIPDSRMLLLNGCGHWPPFEKPQEYAAHVITFLEG